MDDNCGEWVESMGVATGCGFKEIYRFPHTTYPYSSCIRIFSRSINTYLQLRASHGIHMKAAHTVLYMKKHTQTYASYPAMDISCMSVV